MFASVSAASMSHDLEMAESRTRSKTSVDNRSDPTPPQTDDCRVKKGRRVSLSVIQLVSSGVIKSAPLVPPEEFHQTDDKDPTMEVTYGYAA
jgi:hypothetical protein